MTDPDDPTNPTDPLVVILADGTKLGEVDPAGTPVEWRTGGSLSYRPGTVIALRDSGIPIVSIEHGERGAVVEVPARFVRRRQP